MIKKRKDRKILGSWQRTKKQRNIKITVMSIVIGALGTVPMALRLMKMETRGNSEIKETTTLLRAYKIQKIPVESCCYTDTQGGKSVKTVVKNYQ